VTRPVDPAALRERRNVMLWIVLLVVLILYALGEIVLTTDLIRLLLIVALIVLIVQLIQGRRVM
jgi:hypothetical protein